ncbi:hypothetical protein Dimus_007795 [Dionaea muscipula]
MGRRKKKKYFIPSSELTPIVVGMNSDASYGSSDGADEGSPAPLETLEEENELISENDSCPSSKADPEASDVYIDDVVAVLDDRGVLDSSIHLDSSATAHQASPNSSIPASPLLNIASSSKFNPRIHDSSSIENVNSICEIDLPDGTEPHAPIPPDHAAAKGDMNLPSSNFKGKWSSLFANNRKPIEDYMLKKMDVQASEGCLDFSDASLATKFMFDPPLCLIGYFFGNFPGVAALRRLCDTWAPGIIFNLHNSGWIVFRFPQEAQLLHGNLSHVQQIIYEKRPQFCSSCWTIGHLEV